MKYTLISILCCFCIVAVWYVTTTEKKELTFEGVSTYSAESGHVRLPLSGSAPQGDVLHSIPINEIRRGCPFQDCIPSVDDPQFFSVSEAAALLPEDTIGIALSYKGIERYYPFPMLETHELVNDVVAGDPLLVSYCPLCGTGIVFDRTLDGEAMEFGVSGMLWQSNLLMYNRADQLEDRNLWSQVLGQAVVGERAGESLTIVQSNIMRFSEWALLHSEGEVLTTGQPRDPYGGNYLFTAFNFAPDFNIENSPISPDVYVYGIQLETPVAIVADSLSTGTTTIEIGSSTITVVKSEDATVDIFNTSNELLPDIEGFWFSWAAAHPDTQLWDNGLIEL